MVLTSGNLRFKRRLKRLLCSTFNLSVYIIHYRRASRSCMRGAMSSAYYRLRSWRCVTTDRTKAICTVFSCCFLCLSSPLCLVFLCHSVILCASLPMFCLSACVHVSRLSTCLLTFVGLVLVGVCCAVSYLACYYFLAQSLSNSLTHSHSLSRSHSISHSLSH